MVKNNRGKLDLPLFLERTGCSGLRAAATATAASATTAAQRGQWAHGAGHLSGAAPGYRGKYRNRALGGLLAIGAVRADSAHRLELFEFMVTGRAEIFVQRHLGNPPIFVVERPWQAGLELNLTEANIKRQGLHHR